MGFIEKITPVHLDILKEIGNIGAGHAAAALSTMLHKKMNMKVPNVRILSFDEMIDSAGGPERVVASIFLRIEGEAPGNIFFVWPLPQAANFIKQMTNETDFSFNQHPYSEMSMSALEELGNILSGSCLSSLSDFTKLHLYLLPPSLSIDMVGATISFGLIEISQVSDFAIVIDTEITEDGEQTGKINGHFFLLLDPDSFDTVFTSLGVLSYE
jgi:chemotaxis protein CheC